MATGKAKNRQEEDEEEALVDYAAAADSFAGKADDSDDNDDDSSSSSSEEESNGEPDGLGEVSVDEDDEEESEAEDEDANEDKHLTNGEFEQPKSAMGEPCTFDLRNLLAMNAHQINTKELYSNTKRKPEATVIPAMQIVANTTVDEGLLLKKAADGCAQLVEALWQLPKEKSDAGPMVILPSYEDSNIPRALVSGSLCTIARGSPEKTHDSSRAFPLHLLLLHPPASSPTQGRNQMGKVCS